ncbi:Outer membrane lipoprotein [Bartonella clarridgeiae 73]|uniref:Outer membrane lipoprotein n=1 Tax=Bartonella clarridgeiae (strain CCUG 45776 / CIP 104772 / 73) TaxID=696125 RepID=E6YJL7_BARC7|nr:AprI/Inh family metalloprotease inhibitor [Bartonella clarridgeiae]WCR55717.1 MAG: Outer membrane lipoprotein [Bartonella clarridgeiae]CBI77055.1 Outer membrane lipoprotein [Bartonella clarridgeiae 73]
MIFSKISFSIALSIIYILSGCSTSRFGKSNGNKIAEVFYPVQQLLEPTTSDTLKSEVLTPSGYEKEYAQNNTQLTDFEVPGNAVDLLPTSIAGVWNLYIGGKSCRIATPQTKFGSGYRASPLNCPRMFAKVNSWAVKEKKLYFYDRSGSIIAVLYSFGRDYLEGRMLDNQPVILDR